MAKDEKQKEKHATNQFFRSLLEIRKALRHDERLRRWIHYTTLDCISLGHTKVSLKVNHLPTRERA